MQPYFGRSIGCKGVFLRLHDVVCSIDDYFELKTNFAGAIGWSSLQKATRAMRMLSLGTPTGRKKSIIEWHLALLEKPCCVGAGGFKVVLNKSIYVNPLIMILWPKWPWTKIGSGPVCLVVLTACIGSGNYVVLSCSGHIKIRTRISHSYWRLCVITCCEFGMHFLAFLGGIMTLMFSIGAILYAIY